MLCKGFPGGLVVKNPPANAEDIKTGKVGVLQSTESQRVRHN